MQTPISQPLPVYQKAHTTINISEHADDNSDTTTLTVTSDRNDSDLKERQSFDKLLQANEDTSHFEFALPDKRAKAIRVFSLPVMSPHRRLIAVVVLINMSLFILAVTQKWWNSPPTLGHMVVANIFVAILIRQQRLINLLFQLATFSKTRWPLSVRWALAKIYHFGGIHSSCGTASALWFLFFTVSITRLRIIHSETKHNLPSVTLLILTYFIIILLTSIIVLALPSLRSRFHNSFEISHRFLGWLSLAIIYAHTIILIRDFKATDVSLAQSVFTSVTPYLLFIITLSIISPWLTLRKALVLVTKPSSHAIIVQFPSTFTAFPGSSSALSVSPLLEWHSFANIPKPGEDGFRVVISRAGDWTSKIIDNPPDQFWVRGIPTAGVANIEVLFRKVLYVATGSGIGPCLPHLLAKQVPASLFWSTRTPTETYGPEMVAEILKACTDAEIHDTVALGKPDMVAATYRRVKETDAEAVICISNQKLTRKVVYGMESRGIPAFGAIWDS